MIYDIIDEEEMFFYSQKNNRKLRRRKNLRYKIRKFLSELPEKNIIISHKKLFELRYSKYNSIYKSMVKKCTNSKNRIKNNKTFKNIISCYNTVKNIDILDEDDFVI